MNVNDIRLGMTVRLGSGGPAMAVNSNEDEPGGRITIGCRWFDVAGNLHTEGFSPEVLVEVLPKPAPTPKGVGGFSVADKRAGI